LLSFAALAGALSPASGQQTTEQLLAERRLEYQAAKDAYESARSQLRVLDQQFSTALEEVTRARRSGDEGALDRAYAQAHDRAIPYGAQEERVTQQGARLTVARRALVEILTIRLDQLIEQMNTASSSAERAQLNILWTDLDHELRELEREAGSGFRIDPTVMPEITFDPRDVPDERLLKAGILERRAASIDTTIQDVDRQIKVLNDRIRMQRQRADLMATLDRFDDTRLPVVTGQPTGDRDRPAAADTAAARSEPVTLEAQLERLRETREQLVQYRDEHLVRARVFRESVRSVAS
jgi:hypothetical protein